MTISSLLTSALFGSCIVIVVLLLDKIVLSNSYKSKALMTDNEKEFFGRLKKALPDYHIFAQVCLGALLEPNEKSNTRRYHKIRGTFSQKIADYVICDKDINVVAVVELDDRTHNVYKDQKRDAMLKEAGYTVIRWHSKHKPTVREIAEKIAASRISQNHKETPL